MKYEDYLAHFNPNHDPQTGQFSSSKTSNPSTITRQEYENGNRKKKVKNAVRIARNAMRIVKGVAAATVGIAITGAVIKAYTPMMKSLFKTSMSSIRHSEEQVAKAREKVANILGSEFGSMTMDDLSKIDLY